VSTCSTLPSNLSSRRASFAGSVAANVLARPIAWRIFSRPDQRTWLDRYLIAVAATLVVAVIRWWLDPILGTAAAFATFYLAIIFTAWYGGFWPAIVSLALGVCIASYMFDSTRGDLAVYPLREQLGCGIYTSVGIYLAYLIASLTRDIVRRQLLESDLRISQEQSQLHLTELAHISRLSVMGEMAAGLAHELNQPLHAAKNYARGSIRRLSRNPHDDGEVMTALEHIAREADRAAEILRRVRSFVEKTGPHVATISLNEVVTAALTIVNIELKRTGGRIVCDLASNLAPVKADPIQVEQVIVNLARNALEAMHDIPEEQRLLTIGARQIDDSTVEVFVRDCGQGINADDIEKVFDPFFTTKSEGMGMGLAISRSIVHAHDGRVWVTPNEDRGCTFHFALPVAKQS
jgi:signal transduction histidine kinase